MEVKNTNSISPLPGERVNGSGIKKANGSSKASGNATAKSRSVGSEGGVNVSLSSQAKEMTVAHQKAFDIAKNTSAIRQERVDAIKSKIQSGNYQVDSGKVADGMLKEAIKDHLSLTDRF